MFVSFVVDFGYFEIVKRLLFDECFGDWVIEIEIIDDYFVMWVFEVWWVMWKDFVCECIFGWVGDLKCFVKVFNLDYGENGVEDFFLGEVIGWMNVGEDVGIDEEICFCEFVNVNF